MKFRRCFAVTVVSASLVITGICVAEESTPKTPQGQTKTTGQNTQSHDTNHVLASCVASSNQEEVAIAQFAEGKAQHKDVKEFAAMLVKDHRAFLEKLQRFAPEATREGYLMDRDHASNNPDDRSSTSTQKTAGTTTTKPAVGVNIEVAGGAAAAGKAEIRQTGATNNDKDAMIDPIQLQREIAEECVRSSKQALSKKSGAEFDECFIGHQIAMHAAMKVKLVVFERHVSGDLKKILEEGAETTDKHMKKAEEIMKQLAHSESTDSKRERQENKK